MHTHVIQRFVESHALPSSYADDAERWFVPLVDELVAAFARSESTGASPFVVGVNGCQGSGKSTASELLESLLSARGLVVARLSIDDFYLSRQQRLTLASTVHPLLATRGVPGTHDIPLALATLAALTDTKHSDGIPLPRFDKATDNPLPRAEWPVLVSRQDRPAADIVLFEGWCVGVTPQSASELTSTCNSLEREYDSDGRWRGFVNEQLASDYQTLFSQLDNLLFLEAPTFDCVSNWRNKQERRLRESYKMPKDKARQDGDDAKATQSLHSVKQANALMSEAQIARFVQHFERLTRHCLLLLPSIADTVFELDTNQRIVGRR